MSTFYPIATGAPIKLISQDDALARAMEAREWDRREQRILRTVYRAAGIHSRSAVALQGSPDFYQRSLPSEVGPATSQRMEQFRLFASELGTDVASRAIKLSGFAPDDICHLV